MTCDAGHSGASTVDAEGDVDGECEAEGVVLELGDVDTDGEGEGENDTLGVRLGALASGIEEPPSEEISHQMSPITTRATTRNRMRRRQ